MKTIKDDGMVVVVLALSIVVSTGLAIADNYKVDTGSHQSAIHRAAEIIVTDVLASR